MEKEKLEEGAEGGGGGSSWHKLYCGFTGAYP